MKLTCFWLDGISTRTIHQILRSALERSRLIISIEVEVEIEFYREKKKSTFVIQLTWKSRCAGPISPGSSDWIQSCKGIEVTTDVHNPATKEGKKIKYLYSNHKLLRSRGLTNKTSLFTHVVVFKFRLLCLSMRVLSCFPPSIHSAWLLPNQ